MLQIKVGWVMEDMINHFSNWNNIEGVLECFLGASESVDERHIHHSKFGAAKIKLN